VEAGLMKISWCIGSWIDEKS